MKLSLVLLLFLFLFPGFVYGAVDYSGFFRVRGVLSPIHELSSPLFNQTLHFKGDFRPSEKFHTLFWIRSSPEWGHLKSQRPYQIYASGDWSINESLTVRLGKAPYDTDLHQVFSQNDYELYPSVFEGVFLSYNTDISNYHFWGGYFPDRWQGGEEDLAGKYSMGINLDVKVISAFLNRALFHLVALANSLSVDSEQSTRLGLSLQGQITQFNMDYSILTVFHGEGLGFKFNEDMQHISLGYSKTDWLNSYFFAGYHRDSLSYDPWLYNRHENGGLLDVLQWGNLTYILAGYKAKVRHWFDLEARCYFLRSTDNGPVRLGLYGSRLVDNPTVSSSKKPLGWEMDLRLIKNINEEFIVTLLGGVFIYDEELKNALGGGDKYYSQLQLSAKYIF